MLLAKLAPKSNWSPNRLLSCWCEKGGRYPLVPNANEASFVAAEKVRVGKIESLHIDNANQNSFPILVPLSEPKLKSFGIRRFDSSDETVASAPGLVPQLHAQD